MMSSAEGLDDGGVAEEAAGRSGCATATMMNTTLAGVPGSKPALIGSTEAGAHDEDEPFGLEADLGDPVEERDEPGAVRAVAGPVDGEHRGAGVGTLQAADAEQDEGDVADDDERRRPGRR